MKAIIWERYGPPDVLQLVDAAKPTPGEGEVLVRVHASSINRGDHHLLRGTPFLVRLFFGLRRPKLRILGSDVAGVVEAVGANVAAPAVGDAVFGDVSTCGFGAFAEYVCAPSSMLAAKPTNVSFEQAAAVPVAGVTALQAVRDVAGVAAGESVLVNGASGGVGSFAVQIAKALGAQVTAVCRTDKLDMARQLGADHAIDYTQQDPTRTGALYDAIIDAGGHRPPGDYRRALKPGGRYVFVGGSTWRLMQVAFGRWWFGRGDKRYATFLCKPNRDDLAHLAELIETGKVAPLIDRGFPLAQTPEAIRYLEARKARGKVVIAVAGGDA